MGATLEKVARGRFSIQADEAAMTEIQAAILGEETQELSTLARQHAILLTLLQTKEPVSMHYFLETYCISNTTFYADIKQLFRDAWISLPDRAEIVGEAGLNGRIIYRYQKEEE